MRLVLEDSNEIIVREFDIPEQILQALADGETDIILEFKGWDIRQGYLKTTTEHGRVMKSDPEETGRPSAGYIFLTSTAGVYMPDHEAFAPYKDYQTRRKEERGRREQP
jgi:hypothetical protein